MLNTGKILSYTRRAVEDYEMISDGDRITVGVSAGKDSLTLLCALAQLRLFYPRKFDITAITLDCGFDNTDFTAIHKLCADFEIEYTVIPTNIKEVVFDIKKSKHPCALCANLRHGMLNDTAVRLGCNKVALGHHMDDMIETFMMNILYEGRLGTFASVTYLDRTGLTLIRPLVYTPEKEIIRFVHKYKLPVVGCSCPANGYTKRQHVKDLLSGLRKDHPQIQNRIFGAIKRAGLDGYKE